MEWVIFSLLIGFLVGFGVCLIIERFERIVIVDDKELNTLDDLLVKNMELKHEVNKLRKIVNMLSR